MGLGAWIRGHMRGWHESSVGVKIMWVLMMMIMKEEDNDDNDDDDVRRPHTRTEARCGV